MSDFLNRCAFVKAPWQFEMRETTVSGPEAGWMIVEVGACAVCGTDLHNADRTANDWTAFGHEVSGTVREVGEGVTRFKPGDRVALDSSVPCGQCRFCLPHPYGLGRFDLCESPLGYWNNAAMGFGQYVVTPQEAAAHIPDEMPFEAAALAEPIGVALDMIRAADVQPEDRVLVIGPGPIGLGAIHIARQIGAESITLAGRSSSTARMTAGLALGSDTLIEVDKQHLSDYDFGNRRPNKILVTAPPETIMDAVAVAERGAVISFIGVAWGPNSTVQIDSDDFHFRKLTLRSSFASPGIYLTEAIRVLAQAPKLASELISHHFRLDDIGETLTWARDNKEIVKKLVMIAN
jgi:L-iditol 2-dehydrogenase